MNYRDARTGAAVAGALLLAMPLGNLLIGSGSVSPLHFAVVIIGAALLLACPPARLP